MESRCGLKFKTEGTQRQTATNRCKFFLLSFHLNHSHIGGKEATQTRKIKEKSSQAEEEEKRSGKCGEESRTKWTAVL
jgi:hypothetical protein